MLLAQGEPAGPNNLNFILTLIIPLGVLFYLFVIVPERRRKNERETLLKAVKKNDRVIAAGGIFGVVTSVNHEADELTIKVDEATNTKIRVALSSVIRVTRDEDEGEK